MTIPATSDTQPDPGKVPRIVLYDGLCGLCDGVVQFLLRHDKKDSFRFGPQQGEAARRIMARHALDPVTIETICVIEYYDSPRERVYMKSEATLRLAQGLGGVWTLALAGWALPRPLRDACYDLVARNRNRIFGRRAECRLPTPENESRFLR